MDEHIFAAIIANDKAKAFLRVEEFYNACAFTNDLCWHGWPAWRATAAKTAAAAAKAITTAKAAATAETVTAAKAAAIIVLAETVPFISAAPAAIAATPFIETHAKINFPQNSSAYIITPRSERKTQSYGIESQ
jgi:hypothetical protein